MKDFFNYFFIILTIDTIPLKWAHFPSGQSGKAIQFKENASPRSKHPMTVSTGTITNPHSWEWNGMDVPNNPTKPIMGGKKAKVSAFGREKDANPSLSTPLWCVGPLTHLARWPYVDGIIAWFWNYNRSNFALYYVGSHHPPVQSWFFVFYPANGSRLDIQERARTK